MPASEALLDEDNIKRFRSRYRETFGATATGDPLYQAVSDGRRMAGMEHWLPLLEERLATLFDYLGDDDIVVRDAGADGALDARLESDRGLFPEPDAGDAGGARQLPAAAARTRLYLPRDEWDAAVADRPIHLASAFREPESKTHASTSASSRRATSRPSARSNANVYEAVAEHIAEAAQGRPQGRPRQLHARARASGLPGCSRTMASRRTSWSTAGRKRSAAKTQPALMVLPLDHGFTTDDVAVLTEQDMLGDRLVRRRKRRKSADAFLSELATLSPGDLVVHADHGIGRYEGLTQIPVSKTPHDCVAIEYAGGDKLYLPVENIELLSRYGSESEGVTLDRLGGEAWQRRKSRMKERIREIAGELIKVAAVRATRAGAGRRAGQRLPAIRRPLPLRRDRRPGPRDRATCSATSKPASRWTGWSAATSASARPRSRCAPRSSPRWRGCRWR